MRRAHTRACISIAILLACCGCVSALDPSLDISQYGAASWKVRDGFAKGAPSPIAQTPDGYLWLGSEFGLVRFDGVRAVPWQPPGDQHLPSSWIWRLLAARDGTLWVGTAKGLASWKDGKLNWYPDLADQFVFALREDGEGTVWVGSAAPQYGRLCAIRRGKVQCHGDDGSLGVGVFNLYDDSKGTLWVAVKDGIWKWRPGSPKFYPLPGEVNGIQALAEDEDGALLVGWKNGIYRFIDGRTEPYRVPGISRKFQAKRIARDLNAGLMIATWNHGLLHVHQGKTDVFSTSDGLSGDDVQDLIEDREG